MAITGGVILVAGIFLELVLGRASKRYPVTGEYSVVHYCTCIEVQPEYQSRILDAAATVNELIEKKSKQFALSHGVMGNDFRARFVPLGNGNYKMVFWCSNRTKEVGNLDGRFRQMIETCLGPHAEMLDQAHDAHVAMKD